MLRKLRLYFRRSSKPHVSREEILSGLRDIGVRPGELLQVHSSLSSFGYVEGGAATVIDALLEATSPGGTLMMPTFNHGAEEIFDLHKSRSHNGAITELFRKRPGVVRSMHPTHAYAAVGPLAEELCRDHLSAGTFGLESPLGKLAQRGGWVLLLGVGMNRCTAAHIGEYKARVHCIGWQLEPRWVRDPDSGRIETVSGEVWRDGPCLIEWDPLEIRLRQRHMIRECQIGSCHVMRMKALDVINTVYDMAQEICPNCTTMPYKR